MIRAAIIGLGWWGKIITKTLEKSEKIRVVAAVEPNESVGRAFCMESGLLYLPSYTAALEEDLDAIILTTPHRFHEDQVIQAANSKKHVFCEKPLSLSLESATRAVKACVMNDVVLGIGHERRFEPPMQLVRKLLQDGALGELLQIEGNFSQNKLLKLPPDNWRLSRAGAGCGPLTATGIHLLDMALSLGGGAQSIYASNKALATSFESGDSFSSHITLANGAVASINALLATPFYSRFAVFGSRGWIEIRDKSHVEAPTGWTVLSSLGEQEPTMVEYPATDPVLANLEAFATAARQGSQQSYPIPIEELLNTVDAYEAAYESTLNGQIVHLGSRPKLL
uniref:Gfo/Idh/MocA family protein n=1 Tax=Marinobacterium profundum TaxID=1714300 RepID=UPI0008303577|nr:Gfo/Idh/MocA family oxidoreductase [Marinobacterium profundum]